MKQASLGGLLITVSREEGAETREKRAPAQDESPGWAEYWAAWKAENRRRQASYRERRAVSHGRINTYVSHAAKQRLREISAKHGLTETQALEILLLPVALEKVEHFLAARSAQLKRERQWRA